MSQARRGSVDTNRRATQKSHIPYRADDLGHGKKTGVSVNYVDHNSDEFEPFDKVLTQADVVTPPHKRGKRRKRITSPVEEYDEDGEMSMELDDTNPDSPRQYFNNAPRPSAPSSANRSSTTSRLGNRSSLVDYDRVPSPRVTSSSSRLRNGTAPQKRPQSRLSEPAPASDSPPQQFDDFGGGGGDDYAEPQEPESSSPARRNRSFSQIDEDEDEEPGYNSTRVLSSPNISTRTNRTAQEPSDNAGMEDEIDQGLNEVNGAEMSEEEEPPEQRVSAKAGKKRAAEEKPKKAAPKRQRTEEKRALVESTSNVDGLRRSRRTRYGPLEWWRCEKVVYGRRDSGVSMVPVIKDIIRLPKEPPKPLHSKRTSRRGRPPRSHSKQVDDENQDSHEVVVFNPEEGWDDKTDPHGIVLDYVSQMEVKRRVAFTSKMVTPKPAANNEFMFQKIFGDGDFIAAGQLIIPEGGKKPSKGTKDNSYIFYIIEGAINVKIHRTSFILATGAMFIIPRGNNYYLENISQRPAKLFFAQARKVAAGEDEMPPEIHSSPRKSIDSARRTSGASTATGGAEPTSTAPQRSSSIAAPAKPKSGAGVKATGSRANSAAA